MPDDIEEVRKRQLTEQSVVYRDQLLALPGGATWGGMLWDLHFESYQTGKRHGAELANRRIEHASGN